MSWTAFWVIHVSTAAGEAEETAACMYIHYCGLGMRGEIMCFSSVTDCQNKVHTVLQLHGCYTVLVLLKSRVALCWYIRAGVLCDKIITGYAFTCLWWLVLKRLGKQFSRKLKRPHLNSAENLISAHFLLGSFLLKRLIVGYSIHHLRISFPAGRAPADLEGDHYQHPEPLTDITQPRWHTDLLWPRVENAVHERRRATAVFVPAALAPAGLCCSLAWTA